MWAAGRGRPSSACSIVAGSQLLRQTQQVHSPEVMQGPGGLTVPLGISSWKLKVAPCTLRLHAWLREV